MNAAGLARRWRASGKEERVAQVLAVLGLDLDPPSQAARSRKRGLWMAAKTASVSYVQEVPSDTLGRALVSGSVAKGYAAHQTHLPHEAHCHGW